MIDNASQKQVDQSKLTILIICMQVSCAK